MADIQVDELSRRHLKDLQKILESAAERWYSIGEALKIAESKLIECKSNNWDNSTQLLLVLNDYLEQMPKPTKGDMVTALRAAKFYREADVLEKYRGKKP